MASRVPAQRKIVVAAVTFALSIAIIIFLAAHFRRDRDVATLGSASERDSANAYCGPSPRRAATDFEEDKNTLVIFTGRWRFLRILFPYVYRELRRVGPGGVLDKVVFMMLNYDEETLHSLTKLVNLANEILKENVFEMNFLGYAPGHTPPFTKPMFSSAYYEIFSDFTSDKNRYFKIDDDIVYIHSGTFRKMIESKNSNCCFVHFANIVSNWRCNVKHQEMGVYDNVFLNPNRLKFEQGVFPNCGWKSLECAELALRTFLVNYHQNRLSAYLFDGLEMLHERQRFSIQFHMLDIDVIDLKSMLEAGPLGGDDEVWWTMSYSPKFKQPNCIVGESLVVHFSYDSTYHKLLQKGLLREFELIVQLEVGPLMNKELWKALDYVDTENS